MANYPKIRVKLDTLQKIRDIQNEKSISTDSKTLHFLVQQYEEYNDLKRNLERERLRSLVY